MIMVVGLGLGLGTHLRISRLKLAYEYGLDGYISKGLCLSFAYYLD